MRMSIGPVRLTLAMTAIALLVSACGETVGGDETPAASSTQNAPAATGDTAVAAAAPAAQGATVPDGTEIVRPGCTQPSANRVFFRMGDTVLSVPEPAIRDVVPEGLSGPVQRAQIEQAVRTRIAAGEGCPEKPLVTRALLVENTLDHPLLTGSLGLLANDGRGITQRFAEVTKQLQQQPTKNCRTLQGDLLACVGTETRGDRQTEVMYVISTDTSIVMNSGGPLAARCVLQDDQIAGCNIVDEFASGLIFDVDLAAGEYTTDGLRGARDAALSKLGEYRL